MKLEERLLHICHRDNTLTESEGLLLHAQEDRGLCRVRMEIQLEAGEAQSCGFREDFLHAQKDEISMKTPFVWKSAICLAFSLILSYTDGAIEKYRRKPLQMVAYMEEMYHVLWRFADFSLLFQCSFRSVLKKSK